MDACIPLLTLGLAPPPQQHDTRSRPLTRPATLMRASARLHHPIATTQSPRRRSFFDQGLTLIYAFNHDEAVRSFRRAAELDPASPMPHWGIALALGPNINLDVDPEREKAAYDAAQQARSARRARRPPTSAPTSTRSSSATRTIRKPTSRRWPCSTRTRCARSSQAYPDDLDAATLYAESLMDLHPWQLWAADGTPAEGTVEIVAVLESVLRRNADHVGANHYYIHAVEASLAPDRALPSAKTARNAGAGRRASGPHAGAHLHADRRLRRRGHRATPRGAEVDRAYIAATNAGGFYPTMYYNHNLDFLASAAMMTGQFAEAARRRADMVVAERAADARADADARAVRRRRRCSCCCGSRAGTRC